MQPRWLHAGALLHGPASKASGLLFTAHRYLCLTCCAHSPIPAYRPAPRRQEAGNPPAERTMQTPLVLVALLLACPALGTRPAADLAAGERQSRARAAVGMSCGSLPVSTPASDVAMPRSRPCRPNPDCAATAATAPLLRQGPAWTWRWPSKLQVRLGSLLSRKSPCRCPPCCSWGTSAGPVTASAWALLPYRAAWRRWQRRPLRAARGKQSTPRPLILFCTRLLKVFPHCPSLLCSQSRAKARGRAEAASAAAGGWGWALCGPCTHGLG